MTHAEFIKLYANLCFSSDQTFSTISEIITNEAAQNTFQTYRDIVDLYFQLTPLEISFFDIIDNLEEDINSFLSYYPNYLTEECPLNKITILKGIIALECYEINTIYPLYEKYYTQELLSLIFAPYQNFCNQLISQDTRDFLDHIEFTCNFNIEEIYIMLEDYYN